MGSVFGSALDRPLPTPTLNPNPEPSRTPLSTTPLREERAELVEDVSRHGLVRLELADGLISSTEQKNKRLALNISNSI